VEGAGGAGYRHRPCKIIIINLYGIDVEELFLLKIILLSEIGMVVNRVFFVHMMRQ
jgi:hypothetical protein